MLHLYIQFILLLIFLLYAVLSRIDEDPRAESNFRIFAFKIQSQVIHCFFIKAICVVHGILALHLFLTCVDMGC
jgi:hypothetical protein